jgi:hypothetical protein
MKEYHNRKDYDITLYEAIKETNNESGKEYIKEVPHTLRARILTPNITLELEKIAEDENLNFTKKVIDQMIIIFGNDEKFYNKFDTMIMNNVLLDIVQEVILKKNT